MAKFLLPYIKIISAVAFTLLQIFNELGLSPSNFVGVSKGHYYSYFSPGQEAAKLFVILLILAIVSSILFLVSSYLAFDSIGLVICLILILTPGIFNLDIKIKNFYMLSYGSFHFANIQAFLILIIWAFFIGWSFFLILYRIGILRSSFRDYFDHAWYAIALLSIVFFILTIKNDGVTHKLYEYNRASREESSYLLGQVITLNKFCIKNNYDNLAVCMWASQVRRKLLDYSIYSPLLYSELGPKRISDLYRVNGERKYQEPVIIGIRSYNKMMCSKRNEMYCDRTPSEFCVSYPKGLTFNQELGVLIKPVALSNQCIVPSLVTLREKQEKLINSMRKFNNIRNYRLLIAIFLAFLTGIKIVNSTTKIISFDKNESRKTNRYFFAGLPQNGMISARYCKNYVSSFYKYIKKAILRLSTFLSNQLDR